MKYIDICTALYDYQSQSNEELSFKTHDTLYILEKNNNDWHKAQIKTQNGNRTIGLVPSNYMEKAQPIRKVRALYDYQPRSVDELGFKEKDVIILYDKDDLDWYFAQTEDGRYGLIPSNYVGNTETLKSENEPKWGVALYNFSPQDQEETRLEEHEEILVIDCVSNQDWWTIRHKDGTTGVVPAAYIEFEDKNKTQKKTKKEEMQRATQLHEELEKEKSRQLEAERRRKMQEESRQKEIAEKKRQIEAAKNMPSAQTQSGSPRRSEIPVPLPPTLPLVNNQTNTEHSSNKPNCTKIRWWTDRTGAFKVEAEFLFCSNGKIKLFKSNGVKIDVPMEKMCIEDLQYIERVTGQKLLNDNNSPQFSWLDYFKKINIPYDPSVRYAKAFQREGFREEDLEGLTYGRMKSLGMAEKHVRRLQRFIETSQAEPISDDESSKPRLKKKRNVTFGPVTYIEDYAVIVDGDEETGGYLLFEKNDQRNKDGQFERVSQNQEIKQIHNIGLHRRATGRTVQSLPSLTGSDSNTATNTRVNQEITCSQPQKKLLLPSADNHADSLSNSQTFFEDDAWTPRPSVVSSIQQPMSNGTFSTESSSGYIQTQVTPRQRPISQAFQHRVVDSQLLENWENGFSLGPATNSLPNNNVPEINRPGPVFSQNNSQILQQQQTLGSQSSNLGGVSPSFQSQPYVVSKADPLKIGFSQTSPAVQNQQIEINQFKALDESSVLFSGPSSFQQEPHSSSQLSLLSVGGDNMTRSSPSLQGQPLGQPSSFAPTNIGFSGSSPSLQRHTVGQHSLYIPESNNFMGTSPNSTSFISSSASLQYSQNNGSSTQTPSLQPPTGLAPLQSQTATGRSWATATPENPFGNRTMSAPILQTNSNSFSTPQTTGFTVNTIDPNDKYAIFKTINTSSPSILNPGTPLQQQTGFNPAPTQQYNATFGNAHHYQW